MNGGGQAAWGSHALVVAARELLREALKDPHNQKFILLSETAVPVYPPSVIYHHLANERKSRVNACRHQVRWLFPASTVRFVTIVSRGRSFCQTAYALPHGDGKRHPGGAYGCST